MGFCYFAFVLFILLSWHFVFVVSNGVTQDVTAKSRRDADQDLSLLGKLLQEEDTRSVNTEPNDLIDRIKQLLTNRTTNETGEEVSAGESRTECWEDEYECLDSLFCISASWQCDGIVDCIDESDEDKCFECAHDLHGQLIPEHKVCDGTKDCASGEDERQCKYPCGYSEFQCDPFDMNSPCIPSDWVCDGHVDCPGFTDETVDMCGPLSKRCKPEDFVCAHQEFCIPATWRCDKVNDCSDNSDESRCDEKYTAGFIELNSPSPKSLWGGWSEWSVCSSPCDGEQIRIRRCQSGKCDGETTEIKTCGEDYPCMKEPTTGCGTRIFSPPTGRVVGGMDAQMHEWPWQVQIFRENKNLPFCGGSLIRWNWVLTAAHCFLNKRCRATKCKAAVGRQHTVRYIAEKDSVELAVKRIVIHESYDRRSHQNDIALMELENDVLQGVSANVVCLLEEDEDLTQFTPHDEPDCYVTGFGLNEMGKRPMVMQEAHVPLISQETCTAPHVYGKLVKESMLCAGHLEGGIDACQGDSGGPLVCQSRKDGRWYQVGLTSWGKGCGLPNRPGVYTRITTFMEWINNQIDFH